VLENLDTTKENSSQNYFYSTWDEKILKNFVENIVSWFETNTQTIITNKWNTFEHLILS
jgi:hypothetical protein